MFPAPAKVKPKEGLEIPDPGPGSVPWASYVFLRIFPEAAQSITSIDGRPAGYKPSAYVLVTKKAGKTNKCKLSGGFNFLREKSPIVTATRWIFDETRLICPDGRLWLFRQRELGFDSYHKSHWKYYFCGDIYESDRDKIDLKSQSTEGEYPIILTSEELLEAVAQDLLLASHRRRLEDAALLPKVSSSVPLLLQGPAA